MDPPLVNKPVNMQDVRVFTLPVAATTSKPYCRLMRDRDAYKAHISPRLVRGAATTQCHTANSYHIIILRLPGNNGEVWLLFRDSDEYLIAFRNAQGIWFQFSDQAVPANFNPRRLAIKSSHTLMKGPLKSARATTVDCFSALSIYWSILSFDEHAYGDLERLQLHTSTILFSESSRFWSVRRLACFNMDHGINTVLTDAMWAKVKCWAHLSSSYVLKCSDRLQAGEAASNMPHFNGTPHDPGLGLMSFSDVVSDLVLLRFDKLLFPPPG